MITGASVINALLAFIKPKNTKNDKLNFLTFRQIGFRQKYIKRHQHKVKINPFVIIKFTKEFSMANSAYFVVINSNNKT